MEKLNWKNGVVTVDGKSPAKIYEQLDNKLIGSIQVNEVWSCYEWDLYGNSRTWPGGRNNIMPLPLIETRYANVYSGMPCTLSYGVVNATKETCIANKDRNRTHQGIIAIYFLNGKLDTTKNPEWVKE